MNITFDYRRGCGITQTIFEQNVLELIAAAGITIADLRIEGSELENVFMQLTASQ